MKYTGACHCGTVRFEAEMKIDSVVACNCSICSKRGHLLAFTPETSFKLVQGAEALTEYQFGKKNIRHMFCKICGVASFAAGKMPDGTPMRAVNVRCFDGVDPEQFPVTRFDGKSL